MGRNTTAENDDFTTIAELHDPVRAEIIKDLLGQEGIPVQLPGLEHRSLMGGAAFLTLSLKVPRSRVEEAVELIEALEDPDAEIDVEDEAELGLRPSPDMSNTGSDGPYRGHVGGHAEVERPRLKRVASFAGLVLTFGAAHFYAQHPRTGLVLLLSELGLLTVTFTTAPAAGLFLVPLILIDIVGACHRIDVANGERPSPALWARALPSLMPMLVIALLVPRIHRQLDPVGANAGVTRDMCERALACERVPSVRSCESEVEAELQSGAIDTQDWRFCVECLDFAEADSGHRRCHDFVFCGCLPPS